MATRNTAYDRAAAMDSEGEGWPAIITMLRTEDPAGTVGLSDRKVQLKAYAAVHYRKGKGATVLIKGPRLVPAPGPEEVMKNVELRGWTDLGSAKKSVILAEYETLKKAGETPTEIREKLEPLFPAIALPPVGILATLHGRKYNPKKKKEKKADKLRTYPATVAPKAKPLTGFLEASMQYAEPRTVTTKLNGVDVTLAGSAKEVLGLLGKLWGAGDV